MTSKRRERLTLVATALASGIVFLDQSVVNVALPALRRDFDAGLGTQQWTVDGYLLTLASLLLVGGALGDVLGRRRVFVIGLVGFAATSVVCALAPTAELLVAARVLQGAAGALLVPGSLAILNATFPPDERGRAIGTWTAWTSIAFIVGPLVGGVLIDSVSWRLIFAINVPLAAVCLVLTARAVSESANPDADRRLDVAGALLCLVGLAGPVFALIEQPGRGWGDALVAGPLALGLAAFAGFLLREARTAHPMLPLSLFAARDFAVANAFSLLFYAGVISVNFFPILFLQQVAGYSALEAGVSFLPITIGMILLSGRWGALADHVGPRPLMTVGPLVCAAALALMLRFDARLDYIREVLPAVVLFGLGLSMSVAPLTATVLASVDPRRAGVASGVNNAISRVAGLLAIAAIGAVIAARFGAALDEELAGVSLAPRDVAVVAEARTRALEGEAAGASAVVAAAVEGASESGFRAGIGLAAVLMGLAGVTAAAGLSPAQAAGTGTAIKPARHAGTSAATASASESTTPISSSSSSTATNARS